MLRSLFSISFSILLLLSVSNFQKFQVKSKKKYRKVMKMKRLNGSEMI